MAAVSVDPAEAAGVDELPSPKGDRGSLKFSWNRPGDLRLYGASGLPGTGGYKAIPLGPSHPAAAPYLPVADLGMGYGQESEIHGLPVVCSSAEGRSVGLP
ncbi:hypothetical protein ACFWAY_30005 [Rhodococcus sp. NPDC059968]|uniref:hypothetical protein n=1 Tax=Rhodococcus sp. NPDC059968 TaxID=3347017 RepID=UPI003672CCDD